ncbi:MAG: hydrogenase maturation protease [Nitrososphaerota archaeon]
MLSDRTSKPPLIIFIGNPIFKDDKIALIVGEKIREDLERDGVDVEIISEVGLQLIDLLEDRDTVIVVDSFEMEGRDIGEISIMDIFSLEKTVVRSPHYIGLPETLDIMKELNVNIPRKLYVIGINVIDAHTFSEEISEELKTKLDEIISKTREKIKELLCS